MSQQSGDPFAALIGVNTVVQAVVGNGNRDIRGETRAEYQGRQNGQKPGRYQSKTREIVRKMRTLKNVSRGNTRLRYECVCECGLSNPIDEHQVNSNQSPGTG